MLDLDGNGIQTVDAGPRGSVRFAGHRSPSPGRLGLEDRWSAGDGSQTTTARSTTAASCLVQPPRPPMVTTLAMATPQCAWKTPTTTASSRPWMRTTANLKVWVDANGNGGRTQVNCIRWPAWGIIEIDLAQPGRYRDEQWQPAGLTRATRPLTAPTTLSPTVVRQGPRRRGHPCGHIEQHRPDRRHRSPPQAAVQAGTASGTHRAHHGHGGG